MTENLFDQVNDTYEKKKKNIKSIITDINNMKFEFSKDNDNDTKFVNIIDKSKSIRATYRTIGIHNIVNSVWYWGWNIDFIDKNTIIKKKDFDNIISLLKQKYKQVDIIDADELYFYLTNGNFYMTKERLPNLMKVMLHTQNGEWIITVRHLDKSIRDEDGNRPLMYIEYIILDEFIKYK